MIGKVNLLPLTQGKYPPSNFILDKCWIEYLPPLSEGQPNGFLGGTFSFGCLERFGAFLNFLSFLCFQQRVSSDLYSLLNI